jgi:PAS domain S-box-containing protein
LLKYRGKQEKGFKTVVGNSDREMFGEEHFEKSFKVENEIMTSEKSVLDVEEQIEISEGVLIWGSTSRVPLKDKSGHVLGTVVVTRDITKEKEYADELNELKSSNP